MLFGLKDHELAKTGAQYTAREIAQQPESWLKTLSIMEEKRTELQAFLEHVLGQPGFDVLMIGAGTSEYVGLTVSEALNNQLPYRIRFCGTTDLVLEPEKYLLKDRPTLLISFARSGDSPESVGAVNIANMVCKNIYHVFITCNADGRLARAAQWQKNCYLIQLPPETNDRAFAMTSSFSCMYLAALALFNLDDLPALRAETMILCRAANELIEEGWTQFWDLVDQFDFDRVVYLGTGARRGVAQEAALKMLELNAGKVATFSETPLGFRHGPKSIINDRTLVVLYMNDDPYIRQYELDLVKELEQQRQGDRILIVTDVSGGAYLQDADYCYTLPVKDCLPTPVTVLLEVMTAQILSLLKSWKTGIRPDDPCPSGEVNRIVQGVVIYPYRETTT